jgi:hypothetical protein
VRGQWAWLMVGADGEHWWKVVYSDGVNAPETAFTTPLGALTALWDGIDFLTWEAQDAPAPR